MSPIQVYSERTSTPLYETPFFGDMPLVFDNKEARTLYHTLFNVAADKFPEAPLLKAALYLHHIKDMNISYLKHFDIARECAAWIEKEYGSNEFVRLRTVAYQTDSGTIVPYRLLIIKHPLIETRFEISFLDQDVDDIYLNRKYEDIVPLENVWVFKLFGYDFPEIMSQAKAAQLLKKILRSNRNQSKEAKVSWEDVPFEANIGEDTKPLDDSPQSLPGVRDKTNIIDHAQQENIGNRNSILRDQVFVFAGKEYKVTSKQKKVLIELEKAAGWAAAKNLTQRVGESETYICDTLRNLMNRGFPITSYRASGKRFWALIGNRTNNGNQNNVAEMI